MRSRQPLPPAPMDDRSASRSITTLATAFCVGGAVALVVLSTLRNARAQGAAGPADGAPLMRAPLQVVTPVDLKRYAGTWHEQARLPNWFQRNCTGFVSAEYTPLADGTVMVRNRCAVADGKVDESIGNARSVPVAGMPGAGRLEVRFAPEWLGWLPVVWGDYWILKLDRDYQVALVGTPNRKYLWLLSRVPRLDEGTIATELEYARTLGFDVDKMVRTAGN